MATDQRRYHPHLIALEILNKVLNDASSGDQTLVQQVMKSMVVVGRKKMVIFFQNV